MESRDKITAGEAVKITNANLDGVLTFDPDEVAAFPDILFYSGEKRKLDVIGRRQYQQNESEIGWITKFDKSLEEERLLHMFPKLKKLQAKLSRMQVTTETSFFHQGKEMGDVGRGAKLKAALIFKSGKLPAKEPSTIPIELSSPDDNHIPAFGGTWAGFPENVTPEAGNAELCPPIFSNPSSETENVPVIEDNDESSSSEAVPSSVEDSDPLAMDEEIITAYRQKVNLDLYEEDVTSIMLTQLSISNGLSYLRDPYDASGHSLACTADTLVGVWDKFNSFFNAYRTVPHGQGKLADIDGNIIYTGGFRNGKRHGYGTGLIVDPSLGFHEGVGYYQGHWMSNCRHGYGCLKLVSGIQYRGSWYVDKPHGFGRVMYPDDSVIKGYFIGGLQQGRFEYTSADGNQEIREYHRGQILTATLVKNTHEVNGNEKLCRKASELSREKESPFKDASNHGKEADKQKEILNIDQVIDRAGGLLEKVSCGERSIENRSTKSEVVEPEVKKNGYSYLEVDFDDVVGHFVDILSSQNQYFMKQQLSMVSNCCQEFLHETQRNVSKITDVENKELLLEILTLKEKENEERREARFKKLTDTMNGIANVCSSILDRQEKLEDKVSSLGVTVAGIGEAHVERDELRRKVTDAEKKLNELEDKIYCQVCHDAERNCVLMPCMHMDTCRRCIQNVRMQGGVAKCPICRQTIQGEINLKPS